MAAEREFVDIHCHLLPGIDDGAQSWDDALAMARIARADGICAVIVTPHQLGAFSHNHGDLVRARVERLQAHLAEHQIPLQVLPGADVRIEPNLAERVQSGEVVSLADRRRHLLLELPHEVYLPLEPVLDELAGGGMVGILSHPERNQGLLRQPKRARELVELGCLLQITAGSLMGTFGPASRHMAEWLLREGLAHVIASDAHGAQARRPLLRRAWERAAELCGAENASLLCSANPAAICEGGEVLPMRPIARANGWTNWLAGLRRAG